MPNPGVDTYIIDQTSAGADASATDNLYLLSSAGGPTPVAYNTANSGNATLDSWLSAYFEDGGAAVTVQGVHAGTAGTALPSPGTALSLLPGGPGQVIAPELVLSADLITLVDTAWAQNKVTICNGPAGSTDAQLQTLAAAVIAGSNGGSRGAILVADTAQYSALGSGVTVNVPWSVTLAALVAKQDLATKNPGSAAAGVTGISASAVGVSDLRSDARRSALKLSQVNTAKLVSGLYRQYGIRSLANTATYPNWWNWWGSRVVMALRARAGVVGEDFVFGEIDGQSKLVGRFGDRLAGECKALYDLGALFGATPADAYSVDVGPRVNPLASIQAGQISANVALNVSENAEHVVINLIRQT